MHTPRDTVLLTTEKFAVVRRSVDAEDGPTQSRDIVRHPGSVVILPVFEDGSVCLIENYRLSVGQRLLELPAGTLEPGEEPLAAAHRELAEETGYRARRMQPLAAFCPCPGVSNEWMHLFLASGLESGPMALAADEDIRPAIFTAAEALALIRAGTIRDAKTLVGLLYHHVFAAPGGVGGQ